MQINNLEKYLKKYKLHFILKLQNYKTILHLFWPFWVWQSRREDKRWSIFYTRKLFMLAIYIKWNYLFNIVKTSYHSFGLFFDNCFALCMDLTRQYHALRNFCPIYGSHFFNDGSGLGIFSLWNQPSWRLIQEAESGQHETMCDGLHPNIPCSIVAMQQGHHDSHTFFTPNCKSGTTNRPSILESLTIIIPYFFPSIPQSTRHKSHVLILHLSSRSMVFPSVQH